MNKTPDAFTLIELLAVMAITAVLAALIFPLVSMARMAGWRATSTSNLRQLYIANATYAVDNKRYVPTGAWPDNDHRWCGRRNSMSDPWDPTKGLLSPWFGKSNKVNACPLLRRMLDTQDSSITSFEANGGGYGYNDYIGGVVPGEISWTVPQKFGFYIGARPNAIINPARTVMFTTSAYATSSGGGGGGAKTRAFRNTPSATLP